MLQCLPMRIWAPIPCLCLDNLALLGEHKELHAIWNTITQGKKGYLHHPETQRWIGYLPALRMRHKEQVEEMIRRGYNHRSQLRGLPRGRGYTPPVIEPIDQMRMKLATKIKSRLAG